MRLLLACLLTSAALLATPACTGSTGPTGDGDGDTDGGDGDGDGDPGDGDVNPVDLGCSADTACGNGEVCDLETGECVAGLDCSANPSICAFCSDPGDSCNTGTAPTYCDEDAGVCRRAKATCDACSGDAECGDGANFPNKCVDGYCAEGCGACPAGFQCAGGGCVPVQTAGSCESALICRNGETCPDGERCSELGVCLRLCEDDDECPAGQICSLEAGPLNQQCINGCPEGQTVMSGGQTLICHADGRFGLPCPDTACAPGFECDMSDGHCDVSGCQNSQDCPLVRTYCDTGTGECVDGCENAGDCGAFEECVDMQCVAGGCRGKDVSCNLGEWCCGTEFFADNACPAEVEEGDCFLTPEPWCRTCEENDDCADLSVGGSAPPCLELTQQDENGNDVSLGKYCPVGCESNIDCPRGLQCLEVPIDDQGNTGMACIGAICQPIAEARAALP